MFKLKRTIPFICMTLIANSFCMAETSDTDMNQNSTNSKFDKSKFVFGGNIGLQFGDYTVIEISPQIGYSFSKYYTLGAGLNYTYQKQKQYGESFSMNYAGLNLYGRVYPIQYLILSVQPEINYMWSNWAGNKSVPSLVVGGGLNLGNITAMIQYDVVQDDYTPYGNTIFYSLGFTF